MTFTFTTDGNRTVTWANGEITGEPTLVAIVNIVVDEARPVQFNYWGARPANLTTEFDAYITIGSVLRGLTGMDPTVDNVPDNPDGYEPEGVWFDDETVETFESMDWGSVKS